jgi:hypothetical protein
MVLGSLLLVGSSAGQAFAAPDKAAIAASLGFSLTPSNVEPSVVCPPASPGRAECASIRIPTKAARALGEQESSALGVSMSPAPAPAFEGSGEEGGWSPSDLRSAYKQPESGGSEQTVAIVDAYNDPNAESDLKAYREHYKLYYTGTEAACTTANGCFKKINQKGEEANYPEANAGWAEEMSLDLDMVSAICPQCKIMLVEANNNSTESLYPAENEAVAKGATEVSNSWDGSEWEGETKEDSTYFLHHGIPIAFAAGDYGYGLEYPATSPDVIAVGGTALKKDAGTRGWAEEAWAGTGSGCSAYEPRPTWQPETNCAGRRMDDDVAAVASSETPVSVYDSYEEYGGWQLFGGTSVSTPIISAIEAHSSKTVREEGPEAFYKSPSSLFDVSVGANGVCTPPSEKESLCTAELGYDGPTGNGTLGLVRNGTPVVASRASGVKVYEARVEGTVDPEGVETHYHFEYGPTTSYGTHVPLSEPSAGSGTANVHVSFNAPALEAEQTYHYRLVATNSKGTTYGEDHTFSTQGPNWAPAPTYSGSLGSEGSGNGQLDYPMRPAIDPLNGLVVVADAGNKRVEEFTEQGSFVRQFGTEGSGKLGIPRGVAVDLEGHVWVADSMESRVVEYGEAGEYKRLIGTEGAGKLLKPEDVAVDAKGHVWVADTGDSRIVEFSNTGTYLRAVTLSVVPEAVAVDQKGDVWITTSNASNKIEEYTEEGSKLRSFKAQGEPSGVAIDASGNVWVSEKNSTFGNVNYSRVDVFSEAGRLEEQFCTLGKCSGESE